MPTVITANRLADGAVVFLGRGMRWVVSLQEAAVLEPEEGDRALSQAREDEARQIVVEPYAIDVSESDGQIVAKALREAIRAHGPTVRRDLNRS